LIVRIANAITGTSLVTTASVLVPAGAPLFQAFAGFEIKL
jgi:hypothetical protein